jgi:hypothetical protein
LEADFKPSTLAANDPIVFGMGADPEPDGAIVAINGQGPVTNTHPN